MFVVFYARQLDFVFLRHSALELGGAFLFALRNGCDLIGLRCRTQGKQHDMEKLLTLCEQLNVILLARDSRNRENLKCVVFAKRSNTLG